VPGAPKKFEFNPEKVARTPFFSASLIILILACGGGYYQYQKQEREKREAALRPKAPKKEFDGKVFGVATPFTALKQAKDTIKDAGARHKAAYDTVAVMLDDTTGAAVPPEFDPTKAGIPGMPGMPGMPKQGDPKKGGDGKKGADGKKGVDGAAAGDAAMPMGGGKLHHAATFVVIEQLADTRGNPIEFEQEKGQPSRTFMVWAATVRIAGLRIGDVPRVMIGQAGFAPGDVVDRQLGIEFVGYEAETQRLRFRDGSGAEVLLRR